MSLPRLFRGALFVVGAAVATTGPLVSARASHALPAIGEPSASSAAGLSGHRAVGGAAVAGPLHATLPTAAADAVLPRADAPALGAARRRSAASALVPSGLAADAIAAAEPATAAAASRTGESRASFAAALRGTYLNDVIAERDGELSRWPRRVAAPVRVWVDSAGAPKLKGWRDRFPAEARRAFETWTSLGIPVRFVFVERPEQAEVRLRWVERLDQESCGETTWTTDAAGWMRRGDITLAMRASDGALQNETDIRAMALHEVGHLLGLGHTTDSTAIMAPWVAADELSDADRATIKLLYTLPPGRVRKAD